MQVNLLQCQSSRDIAQNLIDIETQLKQLPREQGEPQLVVLPECCLLFGGHESQQLAHASSDELSVLKLSLASLAAKYDLFLVAGTIPILAGDGRIYNRCYLFDNQGETLGHYDKIHLFDVDVSDNTKQYRESDSFCPGDRVVVIPTPFGSIGLAICYDLRFPELFRAMRTAGADIIAMPAAFTRVTGEAHWQVLIQARAIENQCFVLAAAQWNQNSGLTSSESQGSGRETWGQSMIVDPWGRILAQKSSGCGWVQSSLSMQELTELRQQMPVAVHNRFNEPQLK